METTEIKRIYETMFLFDPLTGNNNKKVQTIIHKLLDRADGELILMKKWDERKLAYEIKKQKRGVYWLIFFKAPPRKIEQFERDIKLTENILRALVTRHDKLKEEDIIKKYGKQTQTEESETQDEPEEPIEVLAESVEEQDNKQPEETSEN